MTNKVDWSKAPEGAEFYVHGFFCIGNAHEGVKYYDQLRGWQDSRLTYDECAENIKFVKRPDVKLKEPQPITEIRIGDFIHKSELDTKEKYNDVVRVFEKFGFKSDGSNFGMLRLLNEVVNVNADEDGRLYCGIFLSPNCGVNRQLTYDQIMSLDKKEHIDVDNCNVDKMVTGCDFAKSGVESIHCATSPFANHVQTDKLEFHLNINNESVAEVEVSQCDVTKEITVSIGKEAGCEEVGTPYHPELYTEDLSGRNAKAKDEDMEGIKEAIAGIDDFEFDLSPFNPNRDKHEKLRRKIRKAVKDAQKEQVKSPSHYQLIEGMESIEIIARSMTQEEWKGFCLGNMLKYRIRAGKKDSLQQDIDKANFYGELYEMHKGKCYDS